MGYSRRIVDDELDELMEGLPPVALEGPKAVGKTRTALQRASTIHRLDDAAERELLSADPARIANGPPPVLVDEWQRLPASWDVVRRAVDDAPTPGRFLLTGSAAPDEQPTHSGAGRIATVRMRPLSLAERAVESLTVSLAALLAGGCPPVEGNTTLGLEDYAQEIVASGFPGLRTLSGRALRTQLDGYIERIVERDFEDLGRPVRNEGALRRWLAAYAASTSTAASFDTIRDAATSGEGDKPAKTTTIPYRSVLERLWIIEDVPAWLPNRNHITRMSQAPKHQLADPALAARLLGVGVDALLDGRTAGPPVPRKGTLLGALFESLVVLSFRTYAQAAEARVLHMRTHGGDREVDVIVERADHRVLAVEVKLGHSVNTDDVRHLLWLRERLGDELVDAVVVTTGPDAYRRQDGIAVVPAALLGP